MAEETELARLVVRLVGDASSYHQMVNESTKHTDQLELASRGSRRAVTGTGHAISQLGMALSLVNPGLGTTTMEIGHLTASLGGAMHAAHSFHNIIGVLQTVAMSPLTWVAIPAVVGGLIAWKNHTDGVKEAEEKLKEETKKLEAGLKTYAMSLDILSKGPKPIFGEAEGGVDKRKEALEKAYEEAQKAVMVGEERIRSIQKEQREKELRAQENYAESTARPATLSNLWKSAFVVPEDTAQETYVKRLTEAETKLKDAMTELHAVQKVADQFVPSYAKQKEEEVLNEKAAALKKETEEIEKNNAAYGTKVEVLEQSEADLRRAGKSNVEKAVMDLADKGGERFEQQLLRENLTVAESINKQAELTTQIVDLTKSLEAQSMTLGMSSADLQIYKASLEGVAPGILAAAKAASLHAKMMEEQSKAVDKAAAIQTKFEDPASKMLETRQELGDLLNRNLITLDMYNKALAEAEAQAHKDYTAKFKVSGVDAVVKGSAAAAERWASFKTGAMEMPRMDLNRQRANPWVVEPGNKGNAQQIGIDRVDATKVLDKIETHLRNSLELEKARSGEAVVMVESGIA